MAEMMRKTMIATTIVTGMEIWRFSRYHEAATLSGAPAVQTVFLHVPASTHHITSCQYEDAAREE